MTAKQNMQERLEELGRAIGPDDLIAGTVMSCIEGKAAPSPARADSLWRTITKNRITRLAAAAVTVISIGLGVASLRDTSDIDTPSARLQPVKPGDLKSDRSSTDEKAKLREELEQVRLMFVAHDIDGLVTMLAEAQLPSKILAANYLAEIGDSNAVEALEELSAEYAQNGPNNPFAHALEQIRRRLKQMTGPPDSLVEPHITHQPDSGGEPRISNAEDEVSLESQQEVQLTVRVVDQDTNEPVPTAWLRIFQQENRNEVIARGHTDLQGKCALNVPPGTYRLRTEGWADGRISYFAKDFSVSTNTKDLAIQIAIVPRPIIYGWLTDANENPIQGTVTLSSERAEGNKLGEFAIPEPRSETHNLHVGYAVDANARLGRAFFWKKIGEGSDLDIVLEPLATVVGRIVGVEGKGAPDAAIKIGITMPSDATRFSNKNPWELEIGPDGYFCFKNVPVGLPMVVSARKPGYYGSATIGDLEPGRTLDLNDIVLQTVFKDGPGDWTGTLSGRVVDENNEPMAGLRVWADGAEGVSQDRTDPNGGFRLENLPRGKKVAGGVYADGYGHTTFKVVIDGNDLEIQLFPQGWDLLGKPAPELMVAKWLNTEPVTLDQFGGKVVLLQIGALLPHYLAEYRLVQKVSDKYGEKGLEVIAIQEPLSVTWAGRITEEDIAAFIKYHDITFPFGIDDSEDKVLDIVEPAKRRNGATGSLYHIKVTPALYLVDKAGILTASPTRENLEAWIESLLQE